MLKSSPIQNVMYNFFGPPGSWKTIMAMHVASYYKRIYSNFEIKRFWKKVSNVYKEIEELWEIPFNPIKGIIIVDEGWVNNNSRRSWSDMNMLFGELAMLWRKKNVDIIQISQLQRMADVYYRELAYKSIDMARPTKMPWNGLLFEYDITNQGGFFEGTIEIDLFDWMEKSGYTYDTLETSRISRRKWDEFADVGPIDVHSYSFSV